MPLERKWEKFSGGPAGQYGESLRVTINGKGLIYLNTKMYQAFGRPEAVVLYYSHEDDSIAVEPAYSRNFESFRLKKRANGWSIQASSFCRHFRIRIPSTQRFLRPDLTDEGQLILNLRETIHVGDRKVKVYISDKKI